MMAGRPEVMKVPEQVPQFGLDSRLDEKNSRFKSFCKTRTSGAEKEDV